MFWIEFPEGIKRSYLKSPLPFRINTSRAPGQGAHQKVVSPGT
jgi:hypothetical protein